MATESVSVMVEGGKATAAPPLGPALGPLGINIGKVVADINTKTQSFKGMQVPVVVSVTKETKEYTITVGTPPASALIKKEAGVDKGSGKPHIDHIADLMIEQIIKIAKMKEDNCAGKTLKARVKEIIGTCNSMGIMVEGKHARETIKLVDEGKFDAEIKAEKTELTAEELKALEEERKKLQEQLAGKYAELEKKAQAILKEFEGKERKLIIEQMRLAGIPEDHIKKRLPATAGAGAAAGEAKGGSAPAPAKK
jgi:large subunit ribosomal protein L11